MAKLYICGGMELIKHALLYASQALCVLLIGAHARKWIYAQLV